MTSSSFEITPENRPYIACPHYDTETTVENFWYSNLTPTGGMVSNAVDMARFMHIMLNGGLYGDDEATRILQAASINEMATIEDGLTMGLGLMYRRYASGAVSMGHAGNLQHHTDMFLDFENGIGVFVSVNGITGGAMPPLLGEAIWKAAVYEKTGVSVPVIPPSLSTPFIPENLEELEGWYTLAGQLVLNEEGVLVFPSFQGSPISIELIPMGDGFFESSFGDAIFSFRKVDGDMYLYHREHRQGVRLDPTPAPQSFERWVGRWGTIDEEGNEVFSFRLGISKSGFAYRALDGQAAFMMEVVDDYTIVTRGRTRMHGDVRTFSIEDGVPTARYSGQVFIMLSY